MKLMSFALTTEQICRQEKTVTRRIGWKNAKAGDVVQPVVKGQGIPKGGTVERIGGPIRFRMVTRETLTEGVSQSDVRREGFPNMTPQQFIAMFCEHNGCTPDTEVTRIEFDYTQPGAEPQTGPTARAHVDRLMSEVEASIESVFTRIRLQRLRPKDREEMSRQLAGVIARCETLRIWLAA